MANTESPYRRVGSNSWKELLDQVNDKLENPPDGCDPIDPIEVPDEPHRWAKSDVREVQERLDEMPGDCFEWEDIPDLWKVSIIEDIEGQLENAWCECQDCTWQCDNARSDLERIDLMTVNTDDGDCTECGVSQEDNDWCRGIRDNQYLPAILAYFDAKDTFGEKFLEACQLEEEIEELEKEIEDLEEAKNEACADEDQAALCQELTQQLQEKEDELEEKEADLEEAESERDEARSEILSQGQAAMQAAQGAGGICSDVVLNLVTSGPAPTNIVCGAGEGEIGSDCGFGIAVFRCQVNWGLQQRFTYFLGNCHGGGAIGPFGGTWVTINSGHYDLAGNAVLTGWGAPGGGCQREIHYATCYSSNCAQFAEFCGTPCPTGSSGTMDYRLLRNHPNEFPYNPIDCDGNPCENDEEEEGGDEGGGGGEGEDG